MTEEEQNREIGRMVKERQAHVTELVCAKNKARRFAKDLKVCAQILEAVADGDKWSKPGLDGFPSADDIQELLNGVAETQKALNKLDASLDQVGIKPRGW